MSPPAPAIQTKRRRHTERDQSVKDRRWVNFDLKKFFETVVWRGEKLSPIVAANELQVHKQSLYNYRNSGKLPYLIYQGLVATFCPERAAEFEKGLVIEIGSFARMSARAGLVAKRYHALRAGAKIRVKKGGFDIVPAGNGDVVGSIPQQAPAKKEAKLPAHVSADMIPLADRPHHNGPLSISIPGVGRLLVDQQSHEATELDLLLGITSRLHTELTALHAQFHEAVGKHATELEQLHSKFERAESDHQAEVARLKRELAEAESMLEQVTNPSGAPVVVAAQASAPQLDVVKDELVRRATEKNPELGEFIRTLPFEVAHPA